MRQCKFYEKCGFKADKKDFPTYKSSSNGKTYYRNMCAACFKAWNNNRSKENYLKRREILLATQKERWDNDPVFRVRRLKMTSKWAAAHTDHLKCYRKTHGQKLETRFKRAQSDARQRRDITWTLSFEEYKEVISQPCYYCSNRFCNPVTMGIGIDRLDNNKGYEPGNVVACGKACNTLKMDMLTSEEAKVAIAAILAYRAKLDLI